jgi:hypothetical protein
MLGDRPLTVEDSVDTTRHAAFALAEGTLLPKDAANLPMNIEAAFSELAKHTVKVFSFSSSYFICFLSCSDCFVLVMQSCQHLVAVKAGLLRHANQTRSLRALHQKEQTERIQMTEKFSAARAAVAEAETKNTSLMKALEEKDAEMSKRVDEADSKGYDEGYAEAEGRYKREMERINAELGDLLQNTFNNGWLSALKEARVPEGSSLYQEIPKYNNEADPDESAAQTIAEPQSPVDAEGGAAEEGDSVPEVRVVDPPAPE